jgi:hypothetical protein
MPRFNPDLAPFFSGAEQSLIDIKNAIAESTSGGGYSLWLILLSIVLVLGVYIWYMLYIRYFATENNIRDIIDTKNKMVGGYYADRRDKRIDLRTYLEELKKQGVAETHLCLTNFYISTANATGIFLPGKDGVASENAARVAVSAGARAFVFDVWPDLRPGGNFSPVLQIVESGSLWRRISLNSAPFVTVLKTIMHEIFESGLPGFNDVVVIYLRFRGNPKPQTFDGTLAALQACIEPYRLDASFNNCRGQKGDSNRLFSTLITSLFKKVIVVSNNVARGHGLNDYINIGPDDGIKIEWSDKDALGLSEQARSKAITDIQQNLAFVAPLSEDPKTDNNDWRFEESMKIGIQYIAMNFMQPPTESEYLAQYMDVKHFGRSSYLLKPVGLRYIPMFLSNPKSPENPGWGSGPTAGTPTVPASIQMPST